MAATPATTRVYRVTARRCDGRKTTQELTVESKAVKLAEQLSRAPVRVDLVTVEKVETTTVWSKQPRLDAVLMDRLRKKYGFRGAKAANGQDQRAAAGRLAS